MSTKLAWKLKHWVFLLQTDHLIRASAHAPQCPMVTYTGMGTDHNSVPVTTPSCHVRSTNQDTLYQAGPITSGHIYNLDMGWRNASRSVSQRRPASKYQDQILTRENPIEAFLSDRSESQRYLSPRIKRTSNPGGFGSATA
ncbi:hypothetical protein TNCV_523351 [Trichonephila clavipes]|nr:hypothetical protein TNCV_523351 [Trichonephila clavipes]